MSHIRKPGKSGKTAPARAPRPLFEPDYEVMIRHLREATKQSGLTQVEIAKRLNKTPVYLSKVLNRRQVLTLPEVRNICRACGLSFTDWIAEFEKELLNDS